jgi:hypothetical protein
LIACTAIGRLVQEFEWELGQGEDENVDKMGLTNHRLNYVKGQQWWRLFDAVFEKYYERMLFFDQMSIHHLGGIGKGIFSVLASFFR